MTFLTVTFETTTNLPMLQKACAGSGIDVTSSGITVPHVPASTVNQAATLAFRRIDRIAYPLWVRDVTRITVTAERSNPLGDTAGGIESYIPRSEVARIKGWPADEVERQLRAAKFQGERLVFKHEPFWRERDIR
jgi:hypothetical protein